MATQLSPTALTHWTNSDDALVLLKLTDAIKELHGQTRAAQRRLISDRARQKKSHGAQFYIDLWENAVIELRKYLVQMDSVYREVQRKKALPIDQRFLADVLRKNILQAIQVRLAAVKWGLDLMAKRTRASSHDVTAAFHRIAFLSSHLISEFHRKYEIEIRELSLPNNAVSLQIRRAKNSVPVTDVYRSVPLTTRKSHLLPAKAGGRPRKDEERKAVQAKREQQKSWEQVKIEMNRETGQKKTAGAYRALVRAKTSQRLKPPVQN